MSTAWTKKRLRKDADSGTSKLRKTSSSAGTPVKQELNDAQEGALHSKLDTAARMPQDDTEKRAGQSATAAESTATTGLGLGAYESDED